MARSRLKVVSVLLVALIGAAALWANLRSSPGIPLKGGGELRVLGISLGTNHVFPLEPVWKHCLRAVLPGPWQKPLGPSQALRFVTPNESLVVWVGEFDARGNPAKQTTFTDPQAILEGGGPARGQVLSSRGNSTVVKFDIFPRDRSELALRISDVTETLKFTVKNPRPARPAKWTAHGLPLTNIRAGTRIELRGLALKNSPGVGAAEIKPLVWAFAQGSGSLGWMRWRFTAANAEGNWTTTAWDPAPKIPLLPPAGSPWKLTVEAEEYLSAGFVTEPAAGSWSVLPASTRAREMGVRAAILLAPGAYRISSREGSGEIDVSSAVLPLQSLALSGPVDGTNWVLHVNTPRMGIVCLTELDLGVAGIRMRLRERDRRNSPNTGTAHPSLVSMSTTNTVAASGRRLAAQFFIPRWTQTQELWPSIDGQIEAEIIVAHPPTEFIVDPTMASPPPARRAAPF